EDGLRSRVEAGVGELPAQLEALCNNVGRNLLRGAFGTRGSRFESRMAALAVAGNELEQPAAGDPMLTRQPGRAAPLQHHRLDQVTRSPHPGTSTRKESRMSCDISPGSGELAHHTTLSAISCLRTWLTPVAGHHAQASGQCQVPGSP